MPAVVLIGAQWGDEGKGKATDLLGGRVPYPRPVDRWTWYADDRVRWRLQP